MGWEAGSWDKQTAWENREEEGCRQMLSFRAWAGSQLQTGHRIGRRKTPNKFSINSLMFSAIPGGINKIVSIFNPTVTPMWNDMKHKASGLLSKIGINIENDEDKKFFEKMEKQKNQEKERHILKNSLDDIVDYNRSYLVKIKYSQGGYEPDGILFFL